MDYQTYRSMTIPSKTRKTFTRNTFAEHNYNYAHQSKTYQPPRKTTQSLNHVFSHYWNLPKTSINSVNFPDNPQPTQDYSGNYPFFQQNKNNNIHHKTQTIYHLMTMIIINQIFLHHILKNIAHRDRDSLNHLKI